MKYGHFSQDGYEYIITEPKLPAPWINFLTNERYCAVISQSGGGYSFYKDPKTDRLLYWVGRDLWTDRPGRYVFVRDKDTGKVFSLTWQPLRKPPDSFEARVGLGYQVISSSAMGIKGEITYFVPREEPCEIWRVVLKNTSRKKRNLSVFSYLEWMLGNNVEMNFHNIAILYNRAWFDKKANAIFAKKTLVFGQAVYEQPPVTENPSVAFIGTSAKVHGWDCHKHAFLGPYNTVEKPESIFRGMCNQSTCEGDEAVGVLQHDLTLFPGEERTIVFIVGETEGKARAMKLLKKYRNLKRVGEELKAVKKWWRERVSRVRVHTPDPDFDRMTNIWAKYQLYICNYWSRTPSFYHEGQGGRGYRDSCQDAQALVPIDAEHVKKKLLKIASLIRRDGTCAPGWSDTYGPFPQKPFKDHPVWFTPSVAAYVKETGDINFLTQKTPWLKDAWRDRGTRRDPNWTGGAIEDGEGTVFEHLLAQLDYTLNDFSKHGLPRIGEADWNDGMDMAGRKGIGESVWLAIALVGALKTAAELADALNKKDISCDFRKKADEMTEKINKVAWDGKWYLRGFTDEGKPFGSSSNRKGKIYLIPQSWAILSEVVPPERLPKLLKSVDGLLEGAHGLVLFYPAYPLTDPKIGRTTSFARGTKENAAIFCHANTFMIAADCMVGRGNIAYRRMCKIIPCKKDPDLYKAEPYVYAEYLIGPEHPYEAGRGAYTWVTGTAGWSFLVAAEYILGVKADFKGLKIDPCIPSSWKKCSIIRPFRGSIYEISIENPRGVQRGVKEVFVDGKKIEGNLIRPHKDGKLHKVKVRMGRA